MLYEKRSFVGQEGPYAAACSLEAPNIQPEKVKKRDETTYDSDPSLRERGPKNLFFGGNCYGDSAPAGGQEPADRLVDYAKQRYIRVIERVSVDEG